MPAKRTLYGCTGSLVLPLLLATGAANGGAPGQTHTWIEPPAVKSAASLQQKLQNPVDIEDDDAAIEARFGTAIAASPEFAVVGAWLGDAPAGVIDSGVAYVYRRSGPGWILVDALAAPDAESGDGFGRAVALDGDTLLVGAPGKSVPGRSGSGVVYVYRWDDVAWVPQPRIEFPGESSNFAFGIALAFEGDTLVVGDSEARFQPPNYSGAAYVYARTPPGWSLQATLGPAGNENAQEFGSVLDLSGDTVLVGAPAFSDGGAVVGGAAYVFENVGGSWMQAAQLMRPDPAPDDQFGSSVALLGNVAAVGAQLRDVGGVDNAGEVHLYERSEGTWTPQPGDTLASDPGVTGGRFGAALALAGDTLYVGRIGGGNALGAVLPYTRSGLDWIPQQAISAADFQFVDAFGESLAASGPALLVGAPFDDGDLSGRLNTGSVYVYTRRATLTPQAGPNGRFLPDGPVDAPIGEPFVFGVEPDPGYAIEAVQGCDGSLAGPTYLIDPVSVDCVVSASFSNTPPQATAIVASPANPYEGETSLVTLTASDAEDPGLSYSFDCSNDGSFEVGPQAGNAASCGYATAGDYTAVARASDLAGASDALQVAISVQDSVPTASLSAPSSIDEDEALAVDVGASLPSSGETISAVELDCDYDGMQFDLDASAANAGTLACPGYPTGGDRVLAARARDNEGEESSIVTQTVTVLPINDPPFFIQQAFHQSSEDAGQQSYPGFSHSLRPGPWAASDESGQTVTLEIVSNTNPTMFLSGPSLSATGELTYEAVPDANGDATIGIRACDDGPSDPPNVNCSEVQTASISISAVNDPPDFTLLGDVDAGPGAIGDQVIAGFVTSVTLGPPDEQATQWVQYYFVDEVSDPEGVVESATISPEGTLSYRLSGAGGTAVFGAVLTDSGGWPDNPQSPSRQFRISNTAGTDLVLVLDNGQEALVAGQVSTWELTVSNVGPLPAIGAALALTAPPSLQDLTWTCTALAAASCPELLGSGSIQTLVDLPLEGQLRYAISGRVAALPGEPLAVSATITSPAGLAEVDAADNQASDVDAVLALVPFRSGFESGE